ncbi:MAG TPA: S8 family serine peptidase, partial [Polyangiaceae bacterium]|nr:S8 family serine peptidase [Polyangiaceae bacterium]
MRAAFLPFVVTAFCFASETAAGDLPAQIAAHWQNADSPTDNDYVTLHAFVPSPTDARAQGLFPIAPGFASIRLRRDRVDTFLASHPTLPLGWSPALRPQLDRLTDWTRASTFRNTTGRDGSGVVVGIVDTGVDAMHPDLRKQDGSTRIAWMLDLSRQATGKHPDLEQRFGCHDLETGGCAILDAADIDQAIQSLVGTDEPRDTLGHGTHVASIAAGNGLGSAEQRFAGVAPGATLVIVNATRQSTEEISDADALLATTFVFDRADAMGQPAVVNMSLGVDFGPHDGTSWLEQGLASFVGAEHPGHAIVVAAGNSGGLYLSGQYTFGIHTETRVIRHTRVRVPMQAISPAAATLRGTVYVWLTWREGDALSVGIEGPEGDVWIDPISPGNTAYYKTTSAGKNVETIILNEYRGKESPISDATRGAVLLVHGGWSTHGPITLLLEGDGTAELWLQGVGEAGLSQNGLGMMFPRAVKHGTVSVPATHPAIIAVGASLNRLQWRNSNNQQVQIEKFGSQTPPIEDSIAFFSGSGPSSTGILKPDISAPGAFVAAAMSRDAAPSVNPFSMFANDPSTCPTASVPCMVVTPYHAIASGTSMAAPAVAGALALLLSVDPTLTAPELLTLLQAGARWPEGSVPFPFQMGPGVLDVAGALEAYELLGQPRLREPDTSKSWFVLANAYMRPDPRQPVCGLIETRTSDGSVADGFDAGLLSLRVDGANVSRPLTRQAPGLWTFCVAAPTDSGGGTAGIEVAYQGEP